MNKISLSVGLVAGMVMFQGAAFACPDFTGHYVRTTSPTTRELMTITQTGCDEMHVVSHFQDSESPGHDQNFDDTWLLNGIPGPSPQYPPEMRIQRQFEGDVLVTEGRMISTTQLVHFISRAQRMSDGNVSNVISYYSLSGEVVREMTDLFVRQAD